MEIVVCVKPAPDSETRLRANPAGTALDSEGVKWALTGYDESAMEQALLLKEAHPGSRVRVVSFGPAPRSEEVLRSALALGADAATWIEQPAELAPDPLLAARAVAAHLRDAPWDLVLTGKQAGDDEAGLFGPALGALVDAPSFGGVSAITHDPAARSFAFRRSVEGGSETVTAPVRSVLGLQQAANDPRTAKLPNILKSRRTPIEKVPWALTQAALGPHGRPATERVAFRLPAPRSGAKMIEYRTPDEAAEKLVRLLQGEAKVFP